MRPHGWRAWLLAGALCGCEGAMAPDPLRLDVEVVSLSADGAEATAYLQQAGRDLRAARASDDPQRREPLLTALLARPVPARVEGAALLRLEAAALLCETWMQDVAGARRAVGLLGPMLTPARTLPLDPVTARALVCYGDAARRVGDDDAAASTYMRAIRLMQRLQEEAMP